jgi:hypothetical protein
MEGKKNSIFKYLCLIISDMLRPVQVCLSAVERKNNAHAVSSFLKLQLIMKAENNKMGKLCG